MGDAINDAMNLILPVLQAAHAKIKQKAGKLPSPPDLLREVRKLGGNLQLSISHKEPTGSSYRQQIAWGISDANEMCLLALLAAPLLPNKPEQLVLVIDNGVRGVQVWTIDGQDALCIQPFEFGSSLSAAAGK